MRTALPVDSARNIVIDAAKHVGDEAMMAAWGKAAAGKQKAAAKATERRSKQSTRKTAAEYAMKQLGFENPRLVAVAGYGIKLDEPELNRLISRRDDLVEDFVKVLESGSPLIPKDDSTFASVDKPPTPPLFYNVNYLWSEVVDGVEYTVHMKQAEKGVAIVTIGSSGGFGMVVNPRTHQMQQAYYISKGDAQISGQIAFNGDTFLASLFLIASTDKQKGAGTRVLSLWCRMMAGYGIEAWRGEAVGPEGAAFLKALTAHGKIEILGAQKSNLKVQCTAGIWGDTLKVRSNSTCAPCSTETEYDLNTYRKYIEEQRKLAEKDDLTKADKARLLFLAEYLPQHWEAYVRDSGWPNDVKDNPVCRDNPPWADKILISNWEKIRKDARKHKLPIPSREKESKKLPELGCGHYGCVYATGKENVVFKLTSDPDEIRFIDAASKLGGYPDGIVQYYATVPVVGKFRKRNVLGIWREAATKVGLPMPFDIKTNDDKEFAKATRLLGVFKQMATMVREYAIKKPEQVVAITLGEQPEFDEDWFYPSRRHSFIVTRAKNRRDRKSVV